LIPWLGNDSPFPPVEKALQSPNGLLAAGGDLSEARLLDGYRQGIFPWFNPEEPILWWSPDPRMVLIPEEFIVSHSLAKILRKGTFEVRFDSAFEQVMRRCAEPRGNKQDDHHGTWILEEMIEAYCALHQSGYAHSVEVWKDENLVGGLYGVCIGHMFYGESMFSKVSNGSKIALAYLARQFEQWQVGASTSFGTGMIDCQMHTPHLASLGAREITRSEFIARLKELVNCTPITHWKFDIDLFK